jgi:hypothetical protein
MSWLPEALSDTNWILVTSRTEPGSSMSYCIPIAVNPPPVEPPVNTFGGDFFSLAEDYSDDDFGQHDFDNNTNENGSDSDSEQESSDSDSEDREQRLFELDLERGWEPERPLAALQDTILPVNGTPPTPASKADLDLTEQRLLAEGRADAYPRIIRYSDQYPASHAGAATAHTGTLSDATYTASVNGKNNLWAPFTSEIDWKVARWAKLRGAGSTAFSDLLGIDGVSLVNLS